MCGYLCRVRGVGGCRCVSLSVAVRLAAGWQGEGAGRGDKPHHPFHNTHMCRAGPPARGACPMPAPFACLCTLSVKTHTHTHTPVLGCGQLLVRHHTVCVCLEPVDPAVAHAVAELLLLAPQHVLRQVGLVGGVKGLAKNVLLDAACESTMVKHAFKQPTKTHRQANSFARCNPRLCMVTGRKASCKPARRCSVVWFGAAATHPLTCRSSSLRGQWPWLRPGSGGQGRAHALQHPCVCVCKQLVCRHNVKPRAPGRISQRKCMPGPGRPSVCVWGGGRCRGGSSIVRQERYVRAGRAWTTQVHRECTCLSR